MNLYSLVIALHVVVAVLGVGQLGAIAVAATFARRSNMTMPNVTTWLRPLLTFSRWSLAVMFLSGASMDFIAHGSYHVWWWFRGSALLLFLTAFLVRRAAKALSDTTAGLQRIERLGWWMSANMAVATVLMELRPF